MAPVRLLTFSAERPVEPGRYRREGFEPPFTIEVPDGWFAVQDVPGFFVVDGPTVIEVGGVRGVGLVVDAADPDIEAQVFVPVLEIALGPISIASGRRFELRLVDTADGLLAVVLGGSVRTWEGARIAAEPILASSRFDNDHET